MSKAKLTVPNDRICVVLFGLVFAFIGLFAVVLFLNEVLLGVAEVSGDDFWGTLLLLILFTVFAVIGISEVIRGLTLRSDRLSLKKPGAPKTAGQAGAGVSDNAVLLDTVVADLNFFYTWGFRAILLLLATGILAGGLLLTAASLPGVRWSDVRPTIWPAIFVAMLVLPTIVLLLLNLRRTRA